MSGHVRQVRTGQVRAGAGQDRSGAAGRRNPRQGRAACAKGGVSAQEGEHSAWHTRTPTPPHCCLLVPVPSRLAAPITDALLLTWPADAKPAMRAARFMTLPRYSMRALVAPRACTACPMSMPTCRAAEGGRESSRHGFTQKGSRFRAPHGSTGCPGESVRYWEEIRECGEGTQERSCLRESARA